jgi:hypothetical protein
MMRFASSLLVCATLCAPLFGQTFSDRFKESSRGWELLLERGDGGAVRKAAESMIQRDGGAVSGSDYNEMRVLVALYEISARACVLDGAWEDAVAFLQKAVNASSSSYEQSDAVFSKIRKEHEQKLSEWRDRVAGSEKRIQELSQAPGLTEKAYQEKKLLQVSIDEYKKAIGHSEKSIKEIQSLLDQIRSVRDVYAKSQADWMTFLTKEKEDLAQAGTPAKYVAEKIEQVKTDNAKPKTERLAYGRRLHRLDPTNPDCLQFVYGLLGPDPKPEPPPKEPSRKTVPKRQRKK